MNVLISAGPTREYIDPVRFISNRSSGKMGYALAEQAVALGHEVTLVSGPVCLPKPDGVEFVGIETAAELADAMKRLAGTMDVIIMAAAVADYRPATVAQGKIKKQPGNLTLELVRTEDVLLSLGNMKSGGQTLVGFAAETDDLLANAKAKLERKNLDWIVANDVSRSDRGFQSDSNAVTLIGRSGQQLEIPLSSKTEVAARILQVVTKTAE